LESARKCKIKKFIHISTDEVYGSIKGGSFTEESPMKPNSPYSSSKAAADLLARSYFKTYDMPIIITRSSNNFGPFQYPEKIIPLFVTHLLKGKKVPVYGKGLNVRDWLYVEDNCEAIDFVSKKGKVGEAYNIGGGNEVPNIELTKLILKGLGKDESYIEFVEDRPGHDWRYSLDCAKLHSLGWKPKTAFKEALKNTIKWYKDNEQWWRKLNQIQQ
jgi:dTDP-glucose 4,6-dehydratase